jgi:hypothetical protein
MRKIVSFSDLPNSRALCLQQFNPWGITAPLGSGVPSN